MRDNKFLDQVKDTLLFKTCKGDYYTISEYVSRNEGALAGKKVIYTNDQNRQSASIALYEEQGIDVVVLDALIDLNFASFAEYSLGIDGLSFARVDADSTAFVKEQTDEEKASNEQKQATLADLFKAAVGKDDLDVSLLPLKDDNVPAMLTQSEQGRRFSEMSKIYGQDFKMPEQHTLVLNAQNEVVNQLMDMQDEQKRNLIAAQLYDLARMSTRPLEKDEVTTFLARSHELLTMISR